MSEPPLTPACCGSLAISLAELAFAGAIFPDGKP
jgi:hypothetical protein